MTSRRAFLKALGAGVVTAAVPVPAPMKTFELTGTITAYFNKDPNKCFIRYVEESAFGKHPTVWPGGRGSYSRLGDG